MCTHTRIVPSASSSAEIASSKSFAVGGSIVNVGQVAQIAPLRPGRDRLRRVAGPRARPAGRSAAAARDAPSARRARRGPRRAARSGARSAHGRRVAGATCTRSPTRSPRRGLSTLIRFPRSKNGETAQWRPCFSRTPTAHPATVCSAFSQRLVGLGLRIVGGRDVGRDARALAHAAAAEVAARRREVLADRDVQRAAVAEPLDLLEDALAVRALADDLRPLAVLQRAGDDLRGRGRRPRRPARRRGSSDGIAPPLAL